jgi:microcystin-dependent protein
MSYTITKTDGTVLTTIADGTRDTSTSISLAGPNFVGYGQYLNQNLVYLLENFAGNSAPSATNQQGQLWFDKFNQILKVFTEQGYVPVSGVTNSGSQPTVGKNGDIWFNSSTEQMYVYDSSGTPGFKIIGPAYTKQQGISGAIPVSVENGSISGTFHDILRLQFGNITYATISPAPRFLPTPPIPGFTFINPGLTFSSAVLGPTINANITGTVTGALIGSVTGDVVATTLSGALTGNVTGDLTGNVVATTLLGNLTGNVSATVTHSENFSSSNIAVTGGYVNNLANVTTSLLTASALTTTTGQATNFSTGNIHVTGGSVTGLANFATTTGQATNFSTGNIHVTGGSVTGLANFATTTGQATNFNISNILATGGNVTGLANFATTTGQATNFSTGNIHVTGGNVTNLINITSTNGQITNLSSTNVLVTGGNVSGVVGVNTTFTSANLINSVATTTSSADISTAVATTAFVHAAIPAGIIVMWNSTAATIPTGWQLCNGSNGTPDLRGQFIVGAGNSYAVGDTGGANSVTLTTDALPIHTHGLSGSLTTGAAGNHAHSLNDPGHSHTTRFNRTSKAQNATPFLLTDPNVGENLNGSVNLPTSNTATGISISSAPDHTHSLTLSGSTQSTGGSGGATQPHENRPPYYALCYIQKMY